MFHSAHLRRSTVLVVALALGIGLGGFQSHTALYTFGLVPVRYLLVAAALGGPILYWWCQSIGEVLAAFVATLVAAFVTAVSAKSGPLFVKNLSIAEQNVVLIDAISEGIVYTALTGALVGAGAIVAAIVANEIGVPPALADRERGLAVAGTVAVVLVGALLGGAVAYNYAAAIDQRDVSAEVAEVEPVDDEVRVALSLENRLPVGLHVESLVLEIATESSRTTDSAYPDRSIEAKSEAKIRTAVGCEVLDDATVTDASEMTLSGYVYVSAFNDYEQRVPIVERTVQQPC